MRVRIYREPKSGYVFVNLTYKGKRFYFSTGLTSDRSFQGTSIPGSEAKRHKLRKIVNDVEDYISLHESETAEQMKLHLRDIISGAEAKENTLSGIITQYANLKTSAGTKSIYLLTSRRIDDYDKKVTLDSIDRRWLDGFYKRETENGRMVNGIAIDLRNIRAVINWAIDNGMTTNYPFRRYKIKQEATRKRNLSDDQLRILKANRGKNVYIDFFFLLMYLRGINISDLVDATWKQVENDRLRYRRNKTGQLFDVKIEPEAMAIINKYKGKKHLVYVLDKLPDYKNFLSNFNHTLKRTVPGISTYWSRHTVASIASKLDISTDTIGRMLGHSDKAHSTTDIYINYDMSKVDDAMRRVIDYIESL